MVTKFGWETIIKPVPAPVSYFWIFGFIALVLYTVWKFYIKRDVKNDVVLDMPKQKLDTGDTEEEEEEKERVYTKIRATNNNNTKIDGVHQRGKSKNGPSVL